VKYRKKKVLDSPIGGKESVKKKAIIAVESNWKRSYGKIPLRGLSRARGQIFRRKGE